MFDRLLPDINLLAATVGDGGETEGSVTGLLIFMSIALGVSFLCSILEAVLLSTSLSYVELAADQGKRSGILMRKHKTNVDLPISAILTLNTIAHTVGAAGAGAQAAAVFGNEWLGVISAVLTFLILVFSEIIPKTLGAVYWKQLMGFAAYTIQLLVWILIPVVWIFQRLTDLLTPGTREPTVTRSELEILARVSMQEGALNREESRVLRNLLKLNEIAIREIMTPRTVLFSLQEDMKVEEVMTSHKIISFSRIPIYRESTDDISSFVLRYDILAAAAKDEDQVALKTFARNIQSIPETVSVAEVMEKFMREQEHIFLVFDEYGGTAGIVTLEDAVESLLGLEITDESDIVTDMRDLARQRFMRYQTLLNLTTKGEEGEKSKKQKAAD